MMAVPQRPDPTVHRRRLRSELRRAREAAGFTQRDVARAMDWSLSKLIRIETGAVSITTNDLRALLSHYGMGGDPHRVDALLEIARASRERSWWSIYRDVADPAYVSFLGYESSAAIIRNFEPFAVPGLLQTELYSREALRHGPGSKDPKRLDALVRLRLERQEILVRPNPPQLHFILDEAVIHRMVGGVDVMRRQLLHLKDLNDQPHITIRIVPFAHGMYPNFQVPHVIFEFPDPEDDSVLFIEQPFGDMIVVESSPEEDLSGERPTPTTYLETFWQLEQAATREDTHRLLDLAMDAMDQHALHAGDLAGADDLLPTSEAV